MKNKQPLLFLLCLFVTGQLLAQEVQLTNIKPVNSERLDFAPVPFNNGIIYTSSKENRFLSCPSDNPGDYTDMFYAPKNADGTFGERVKLKGDINGKYNDGSASVNATGDKMMFTRNNLNGKNAAEIIDLKLYYADKVGDDWVNVTSFPHNSDDWSTCHPALSGDGSWVVFASNRPGSKGGSMDLWASKSENGTWSEPINLDALNTEQNELFPYLDGTGNLYFSSNRPGGQGGLDLYYATPDGPGEWLMGEALEAPFNSGNDDVNFVPLSSTEGYLATADRSGGAGMDDIWVWKRTPSLIEAIIVVIDEKTGERLANAEVDINPLKPVSPLDKLSAKGENIILDKPMKLMTDANGAVKIQVFKNGEYAIGANKTPYQPENRQPTTAQLTEKPEYIIPLKRKSAVLKIIVEEDPTKVRIPLADIKILDKTTGKVISLVADGSGGTSTEIDCDHNYEITASKDPYYDNTVSLKDFQVDCADGEVTIIVPLKKPIAVELAPIFYDFDKSYIRKPDATHTLDSLVILMNRYPTLQVNLGAHCDARGTDNYNIGLSKRRATAAKKYLTDKGIDAARITTSTYGEEKPINNCTDGVKCTEPAHQLNRRVDVEPTRHQERGIEFKVKPINTNIK